MLSEGFEPAIPGVKRLQAYALDPTATWIEALHIEYCTYPQTLSYIIKNSFIAKR
jgi:hypothetical protein